MQRRPYSHRTGHGLALPKLHAAEIARKLDGLLEGPDSTEIFGAATVELATNQDLAFYLGSGPGSGLPACKAGILLVPFGFQGELPSVASMIQVQDPYKAMTQILKEFHEPIIEYPEAKIAWDAEVHPSAVIQGVVWPGAKIGPFCVVMDGAEVGWNTILESHVTLYPGARIGSGCILQAGVVVGARGFGFRLEGGNQIAVPHYGGVEIEDHVQIGANSVVASGFLEPTRIGESSCLDSFVQIAHHCQVGARVMMASGAGLAGGVRVGDGAVFGGAAQVAQHVCIGAGARIAAKSGVTKDVPANATVAGFPAEPIAEWRRAVAALRRLASRKSP